MAIDETELARIRTRYADEAPDVRAWRVDYVRESWRDVRTLIAEVERLGADRAALLGRLDELGDRWAAEFREFGCIVGHEPTERRVRAEMLCRLLFELGKAISGE